MRDSCSNYIGHNGGPTRPERHAQAWNNARYQKAAERTGRVHCSDDTIENSMAITCCMKLHANNTSKFDAALLPLLLAAGRTPLQLLFHEEKEGFRTDAGLRKHEKRSRVHVRWSQQRRNGLQARQRARDRTASKGPVRRGAWLTLSIDPKLTKTSRLSDSIIA